MHEAPAIRMCTADDIAELTRHEPPNARIAESHFRRQSAGDLIYGTAWADFTALGEVVLDFRAEFAPELKHLFVYGESRGKGVGRALSLWAEEQARLSAYDRIYLGVDPGNTVALKLYEDLGYAPTGESTTVTYRYVDEAGIEQMATEQVTYFSKLISKRTPQEIE